MRNSSHALSGVSRPLVAITGGGTGGHVYPALSVVRMLRRLKPNATFMWMGTHGGMERSIVRKYGIRYFAIPAGKFRRYISFRNVTDLVRIAAGLAASLVILLRNRPDLLFAKGGYVTVPPVVAAKLLGIPIVTHESDLDPGVSTRLNARFAQTILVSYERSIACFSSRLRNRVVVAGIPIRPEIEAADRELGVRWIVKALGSPMRTIVPANTAISATPQACGSLSGDTIAPPIPRLILLVLGGSQGALQLNSLVEESISALRKRWIVVHQTGKSSPTMLVRDGYIRTPFLSAEYADVLAAADCVVCRAGATTIWECAYLKRPMILVPLGRAASRGDQIRNAEYFDRRSGARILSPTNRDPEGSSKELIKILDELANDVSTRARLGVAARSLILEDATERIGNLLLHIARKNGRAN